MQEVSVGYMTLDWPLNPSSGVSRFIITAILQQYRTFGASVYQRFHGIKIITFNHIYKG
jgi:hypothetical protein